MRPSEAIKIIKRLITSVELVYKTNPLTDKEPHPETDALTLAIYALEKQEAGRWIPVTERLPEENGTYLACYEDATVLLDWFNGKWFFYRTNPAVEETGTIIAWRPLPEPYTEENS